MGRARVKAKGCFRKKIVKWSAFPNSYKTKFRLFHLISWVFELKIERGKIFHIRLLLFVHLIKTFFYITTVLISFYLFCFYFNLSYHLSLVNPFLYYYSIYSNLIISSLIIPLIVLNHHIFIFVKLHFTLIFILFQFTNNKLYNSYIS